MKIVKIFAFVAMVLVMAACGTKEEAAKVADKISNGEQLTQSDYSVMIDYCAKYAEEAQVFQDKINVLAPTSEEAGKLTDDIASLSGKFPLVSEFFSKLSNCTKEEVGADNVAKINKLSALTWFTAPEWADSGNEDGVVGDVVDMPAVDSAGVIATGDGEVVK